MPTTAAFPVLAPSLPTPARLDRPGLVGDDGGPGVQCSVCTAPRVLIPFTDNDYALIVDWVCRVISSCSPSRWSTLAFIRVHVNGSKGTVRHALSYHPSKV